MTADDLKKLIDSAEAMEQAMGMGLSRPMLGVMAAGLGEQTVKALPALRDALAKIST